MTVQVKALSCFQQDAQTVRRGDTIEVTAKIANELEKAGLVERVNAPAEQEPAPTSAPAPAPAPAPIEPAPQPEQEPAEAKMAAETRNKAAAPSKNK